MGHLYLEIMPAEDGDDNFMLSLESLIILLVLKYVKATWIKVVFVTSTNINCAFCVKRKVLHGFDFQVFDRLLIPVQVLQCHLPIISKKENFYVAGLCAVLRYIIKKTSTFHSDEICGKLLGFRSGCLMACAEVSVWTKFCEMDILETTKSVFQNSDSPFFLLPIDLLRFENHLRQSVRIHNISKHKQNAFKSRMQDKTIENLIQKTQVNLSLTDSFTKNVDSVKDKKDEEIQTFKQKSTDVSEGMLPQLDHLYAEGIDRTLADVILLMCIHFILTKLKKYKSTLVEHTPLVLQWYTRMLTDPSLVVCLQELVSGKDGELRLETFSTSTNMSSMDPDKLEIPQITPESLYIRDPTRGRAFMNIKHHQSTIEETLTYLREKGIVTKHEEHPCKSVALDWSALPEAVHPIHGQLPADRSVRKCQQLESLISIILRIAKEGDVIVDFCSGGGHLGIVLAYLLPKCQIIMVDNKEESLSRALQRIEKLNLTNTLLYQTNIDYFKGNFSIGTSLHACGVATDLVLNHCLKRQAAVVACPCCYGGIKNVQEVTYPRSKKFCDSDISYKKYCLLGHAADQTHLNDPKLEQGKLCMGLIDADRLSYLEENGYVTLLCSLVPPECTPKNNILAAYPRRMQHEIDFRYKEI